MKLWIIRDFCICPNMHQPPTEGSFSNELNMGTLNPTIVFSYNTHIGYIDKTD
jgi:hypothetical protein